MRLIALFCDVENAPSVYAEGASHARLAEGGYWRSLRSTKTLA